MQSFMSCHVTKVSSYIMSPDILSRSYIYIVKPVWAKNRKQFSHTSCRHLSLFFLSASFDGYQWNHAETPVECITLPSPHHSTLFPCLQTAVFFFFNTHAVFFHPGPLSFLITLSIPSQELSGDFHYTLSELLHMTGDMEENERDRQRDGKWGGTQSSQCRIMSYLLSTTLQLAWRMFDTSFVTATVTLTHRTFRRSKLAQLFTAEWIGSDKGWAVHWIMSLWQYPAPNLLTWCSRVAWAESVYGWV